MVVSDGSGDFNDIDQPVSQFILEWLYSNFKLFLDKFSIVWAFEFDSDFLISGIEFKVSGGTKFMDSLAFVKGCFVI